jgi:hypothetical protein
MPRKNSVGDGGSASQKRALGALPDAVRATKKSSKQVASGTTAEKGAADKDQPTTNRLMQGTQYPTCNLVMPQLYQMITKLEMNSITYVHTARKETITIQAALEKAANPDMTKRILKARTQMVESMYEYFDAGLSESHRAKLYICTLLDPRFKNYNMWPTRKYVTIHTYAQSVCSVAKLNDRG